MFSAACQRISAFLLFSKSFAVPFNWETLLLNLKILLHFYMLLLQKRPSVLVKMQEITLYGNRAGFLVFELD